MQRGFSEQEAERMAIKLLKRVRRRHRYEILKGIRNTFQSWLFRWVFLTQWRATIYHSFCSLQITWVGRGFNPDYTQNCAGNCVRMDCWNYVGPCGSVNDCLIVNPSCSMGTCGCPAPLANSTQVSNSCVCQYGGNACTACSSITNLCTTRWYSCPCAGTCGYNCNTGYTWNGSQCVLSAARKSMLGDGSSMIVNNA
jgi:hypothetical protein